LLLAACGRHGYACLEICHVLLLLLTTHSAGAALQAPKLPNAADMSIAKRLLKKYNHSSSVCIGLPGNKDPQQFKVGTIA
jgi:hypothetical protein